MRYKCGHQYNELFRAEGCNRFRSKAAAASLSVSKHCPRDGWSARAPNTAPQSGVRVLGVWTAPRQVRQNGAESCIQPSRKKRPTDRPRSVRPPGIFREPLGKIQVDRGLSYRAGSTIQWASVLLRLEAMVGRV